MTDRKRHAFVGSMIGGGIGLLALAANGIAGIDGDLRVASAVRDPVPTQLVVQRSAGDPCPERGGARNTADPARERRF